MDEEHPAVRDYTVCELAVNIHGLRISGAAISTRGFIIDDIVDIWY